MTHRNGRLTGPRIGPPAPWPRGWGSARTRWPGSGPITTSSRGRWKHSRSATIPVRGSWSTWWVYLRPPARAVVFSFDEKTSARRWIDPAVAADGGPRTMTHDYKRNGTIDLFAAMNIGHRRSPSPICARVMPARTCCGSSSRSTRVSRAGLAVHVVLDNLSAHNPRVAKWLAHKDRRRWHLHFTPTSSSWLNLVERWFKELTDKRLRRGASPASTTSAAITGLGRALEQRPQALHLESHRRGDHREGPTRPRHPPPDQNADGPLGTQVQRTDLDLVVAVEGHTHGHPDERVVAGAVGVKVIDLIDDAVPHVVGSSR